MIEQYKFDANYLFDNGLPIKPIWMPTDLIISKDSNGGNFISFKIDDSELSNNLIELIKNGSNIFISAFQKDNIHSEIWIETNIGYILLSQIPNSYFINNKAIDIKIYDPLNEFLTRILN